MLPTKLSRKNRSKHRALIFWSFFIIGGIIFSKEESKKEIVVKKDESPKQNSSSLLTEVECVGEHSSCL